MILPLAFLLLFILGAAFGSFLSVLVYRLHAEEKPLIGGRSHCTDCKTTLKPLDLVPLLSYLTLRGRCRYCSKDISYMYPLIEVINGTLFVLLFLKFPFLSETLQLSVNALGLYLLHASYACILIFTFFFDLKYRVVADQVLLPAILIGLIATIASPLTPSLVSALIASGIALVFFGLQILISQGKWVGSGDVRVGVFMGVILGWELLLVALFCSYIIGSLFSLVIAARQKKIFGISIPFAPFLVTGTFIAMFLGDDILRWYLGGFGLL